MGNIASKILNDDTAYEVEWEYNQARSNGLSGFDTAKYVLGSMKSELEDSDEKPIVYLVLAYLLHRDKLSVPSINNHAIVIIKNGEGLDRYRESGEEILNERLKVLNALLDQLSKPL